MAFTEKCVSKLADALKKDVIDYITIQTKFHDVVYMLVAEAILEELGEIDDKLHDELTMCLGDRIVVNLS